jgi:hypothetical protein
MINDWSVYLPAAKLWTSPSTSASSSAQMRRVGFSTTTNYEAALQRWRCLCVNVTLLNFENAVRVLQKCCVTDVSAVAVGKAQRCSDIHGDASSWILIFMQRSLVSTGVRNLTEKYAETIVQYGFYGDLKGYLDGMCAF